MGSIARDFAKSVERGILSEEEIPTCFAAPYNGLSPHWTIGIRRTS